MQLERISSILTNVGLKNVHMLSAVLESMYSDRVYHNLSHICYMFELASMNYIDLDREESLAIVFHDIVYLPAAPDVDNVEASIRLMYPLIKHSRSGAKINVETVAEIIRDTSRHTEALSLNDFVSAYVVDLDIAILGESASVYDSYVRRVREEYQFIPDEQFYNGRMSFLKKMLAKKRLFYTNKMKYLEMRARNNMMRELAKLEEKLK